MKRFFKKNLLRMGQFIFYPVFPVALVVYCYATMKISTASVLFMIGFGLSLIAIIVFAIFKLFKINPKLKDMREENERLMTDWKIETDVEKIRNIEAAIKNNNSKQAVAKGILPVLFLVSGVLLCYAAEQQLAIFSGAFSIGAVSYGVSRAFEVFKVRQIKSKAPKNVKNLMPAEEAVNDIG